MHQKGNQKLGLGGKEITPIDPLKTVLVELVGGTIVLASSAVGVPVSLAEIITCSVIGFSCAHLGIEATARNNHVQTIYKLWPACPLLTAAASFGISSLTKALLHL